MQSPNPSPKPSGKNRRECPALGTTIPSAECGAKRVSQIRCTADCPFNPFGCAAEYAWGHLEDTWTNEAIEYAKTLIGRDRTAALLKAGTLSKIDKVSHLYHQCLHLVHVGMAQHRDSEGRDGWGHWASSGYRGLNNDARVLSEHFPRAYTAVIEVQRIQGARITATDLLAPERPPFTVLDELLAEDLVVFDRVMVTLCDLPYFTRVFCQPVRIDYAIWTGWKEQLEARYASYRTEGGFLPLGRWLLENFVPLTELAAKMEEPGNTLRPPGVEQLLADLVKRVRSGETLSGGLELWCLTMRRAKYEGDLVELLRRHPDHFREVVDGAEKLVSERGIFIYEPAQVPDAIRPHGRVYVLENGLSVYSHSDYASAMILMSLEEVLGNALELEAEDQFPAPLVRPSSEDAGSQDELSEQESPDDSTDDLPDEPDLEAKVRHWNQSFPDKPVRALGGITPRDAAKDPMLRPKLIELMKEKINGLAREKKATPADVSLDPLLDTLGLPELKRD